MTYAIMGMGPDGVLDLTFGGMVEDHDKMAVCYWNHQRQPFLLRDIDGVTSQDISAAVKKSRGEIGFLPLSSKRSFSIECGSPDQREQALAGMKEIGFAHFSSAYARLDGHNRNLVRNLSVVAAEDSNGVITPRTNMLTHQWYDDSEHRYFEEYGEGQFDDRRRLHFFVANSIDAMNVPIADTQDWERAGYYDSAA